MFAPQIIPMALPPAPRPAGGGTRPDAICVVGTRADGDLVRALGAAGVRAVLLEVLPDAESPVDGLTPDPACQVVSLEDFCRPVHAFLPLRSLGVHRWLAAQSFDHVLFCAPFACGYYSAVARDLGLFHQDTGLWIVADTAHGWHLQKTHQFPDGRTDIERDYLEQQTAARVDGIFFRDTCLAQWMAGAEWVLPSRLFDFPPAASVEGVLAVLAAAPRRDAHAGGMAAPFVSVCMPTYNRPEMLQEAVASLLRQDDAGFEVIVVDDGSTDDRVAKVLEDMAPVFRERGWTIIRQPNAGPAAARRAARARAKGSHILLMDDDNIALSHEIGMFRRAAMSGADILTCVPGQHPANTVGPAPVATLPGTDADWPTVAVDWTPVGPCHALAIFTNCLGDNNCLVRAEVFDALGGQGNDPQNVFEDYVFLLRAMFAGYRIEVIPEVLFLYRRHEESRCMGSRAYYSHLKSLETFFECVPAPLRPLLLTLRKEWYDRHKASCVEDGQA